MMSKKKGCNLKTKVKSKFLEFIKKKRKKGVIQSKSDAGILTDLNVTQKKYIFHIKPYCEK